MLLQGSLGKATVDTNNHLNLKSQGFRLPAEWEHQEAICFTWPRNVLTWPHQLESVRETFVRFIQEVSESQMVWLLVDDSAMEIEVRRRLTLACVRLDNVKFFHIPAYDSWIRDYGPMTVRNVQGQRLMTDWLFNGWGEKYDDGYASDTVIPVRLSEKVGINRMAVPMILEGGSIDTNGKGTLITTTNCLLNANRNFTSSKQSIEAQIKSVLGVDHIIWVSGEIKGDDTDGHIDDAVRFVDESTVCCILEDRKDDVNYEGTQKLYAELQSQTLQNGLPLRVVPLPMPDPVYCDDMRLPASYANFLITNHKVLVPIYNCSKDAVALEILQSLFPGRKVVGIDCEAVVYGFGSIHCLSMQIPS